MSRPGVAHMWRYFGVIGVVVLAAALSGCDGGGGSAGNRFWSVPTDGAVADPLAPSAGPGPAPVAPVTVVPEPVVVDAAVVPVVLPWEFVQLADHGRTVMIKYLAAAGCLSPHGVVVREGPDSVVIAPVALDRPGEACPAVAYYPGYGTVSLAQPLRSRPLLHPSARPDLVPLLHAEMPASTAVPTPKSSR